MTNRKVAHAVRVALVTAGALSAGLYGGVTSAQTEPAAQQQLVEIVVTGSRIVRKELVSAMPVQVVDSQAIATTGLNNIGDVLQNLSATDGTGLRPITTATNGSDGSMQISLRNLGAERTLILVDGRRWVTDPSQIVDLNTIPLAMIDRIEVLKDGASAIYGSDAIAGVINVITKKDFSGVELRGYYGQTAKGDGTQQQYSITMGASGERSNAVMSFSFSSQDAIYAGNRNISAWPYYGCDKYYLDSSLCGSSYPAYGRFWGVPNDYNASSVYLNPGQPGTSVSDFIPWSNAGRYNFAPVNYLQQPIQRWNIFTSANYELTDHIQAYGKLVYVKRRSAQQLAQVPLTVGVLPGAGPQWQWRPGANITADNYFNPFGVDIDSFGFRMIAVGPRNPTYDYDTMGINLGVKGDFQFADHSYHWDVGGQRNDGQYDSVGNNYINLFNLANALGPSFRDAAGLHCGTPGNVIRGCVPFNVFGGPDLGVAAGVITPAEQQAMINYVSYTQVSASGNTTNNWYADLSGDLFKLPGGTAAFAVGVEYRKDMAFEQPDALVAGGGSSDNYSEPTHGQTTAQEAYLELNLPLLAGVPGAQELTIDAAGRYSDYSGDGMIGSTASKADIGSDTTAKVSLNWRPIQDLLVRATWGQTFRAPNVVDLYGGGRESFPSVGDPCNTSTFGTLTAEAQARCIAAGVPDGGWNQPTSQLRTLLGGNPNLKSESGDNLTVGLVWTPSFVDNLDITLDYWHIKLNDALTTYSASTILNGCIKDGNQGYCSFIERNPDGSISVVRTASFNAAKRDVEGLDVGARYAFMTDRYGTFKFAWDTTWTMHDKVKTTPTSDWFDWVGIYQGETNWEYRSNFVTNWQYGDFGATWTMRYVSRLEEDCWVHYYGIGDIDPSSPTYDPVMCSNPNRTNLYGDTGTNFLGARLYHDLQVSYNTKWDGILTVGARNIFGTEPPKTQNSFAHSFDGAYDLPGGAYWYASYNQKF